VAFHEVGAGMGAVSEVTYLQGYCPAEWVEGVRKAASKQGWGLLVDKPEPDEEIPTLIRHPHWVKPIKVVLDFIGVLPGYREVDMSGLFLIFFSLFFAMIVGDAGYGILFLGLTFAGMKWLPKAPPSLWRLLFIMSVGTIVWGLLSGNFFGVTNLPAPLRGVRFTWLSDDNNLMLLCFLIGSIHLTIAHGWNVVRISNSPQALAQVGWICLTWTMFFGARTMVLGESFPAPVWYLFGAGFVLVLVFMQPFRKIASEWHNYVMLPLDIVSNFVDVVSYVRLFAVGLATFAVASAFNTMGADMAANGWIAGLGGALVIFGGHAFNIILALMGVLVHGVRLNTLEFSSHLGLTWSGSKYSPFAVTAKDRAPATED
jgi:V/A-type H+-transporting ATPase subunit I